MGKSNWEMFQSEVIDHCPNCHRCQHSQNGSEMERDEPNNADQKYGMGQGFHGLKSERSPGRRTTRSVMSLVRPAVKTGTMEEAMGNVKEAVLQNQNQEVTRSYVPPTVGAKLIIDPGITMQVELNCSCHCHRKDGCRNHRQSNILEDILIKQARSGTDKPPSQTCHNQITN